MKEFHSAIIEEVTELSEGVYADSDSGLVPPTPPTDNTPGSDIKYTIEKRWSNHDSGHFSCAHINLKISSGGRKIAGVIVSFGLPVNKIDGISTPGNFTVTKSGSSYIFTAQNIQNDSDNFCFSFNNTYFKNTTFAKCDDNTESFSYEHRKGYNLDQYAPDNEISVTVF